MPEAYRIAFTRSAVRELRKLPEEAIPRLVKRIEKLSSQPRPHGCEKLVRTDLYRIRQGDYRVLYSIDDKHRLVEIIKIGHRREVYR